MPTSTQLNSQRIGNESNRLVGLPKKWQKNG
jgi:hypothetical protein